MRNSKTRIIRPTSPFDDLQQAASWEAGFQSAMRGGFLRKNCSIYYQIGYKAGAAYLRTRDQFAAVGGA